MKQAEHKKGGENSEAHYLDAYGSYAYGAGDDDGCCGFGVRVWAPRQWAPAV